MICSIKKELERIKELENVKRGFKRIVLEVGEEGEQRRIAFNGKWLVKEVRNYDESEPWRDCGMNFSVELTEKGSYLSY